MKTENIFDPELEPREHTVKFRCRHSRESLFDDVDIALRNNRSPDEFQNPPSEGCCFVCGRDVHDSEWFARMNAAEQTQFLCSAQCAKMFFEVEQAPAHDHRARHNFELARDAILEAANHVMRKANA